MKSRSPRTSRRIVRSRSRSRPSKGWKQAKPKSVGARQALKEKCGSRCFLLPSKLKFPICNKNCKVDCRGLVAAKSRAGEWKYRTVYKKANALINKGSCTIKSRSRRSKK